MRTWLLDTNIVILLSRSKPGGFLSEWVREYTDSLFLSVISVVEISAGIRKLRREGEEQRASRVDIWLDNILAHYGERILAVDAKVGKLAGELADEAEEDSGDQSLPYFLIAATAQAHGHVLLTKDVRRFQPLMPAGQLLPFHALRSLARP